MTLENTVPYPSRQSRHNDKKVADLREQGVQSGPTSSTSGDTSSSGLGGGLKRIMKRVDEDVDPAIYAQWNLSYVKQAVDDMRVTPALPGRDRIIPNSDCLRGSKHKHVYWLVERPRAAQHPGHIDFCIGDIVVDMGYSDSALRGFGDFDPTQGPSFCAGIGEKRGIIPEKFCKRLTPHEARLYELATLRPALQANSENWNIVGELGKYLIGSGQRERTTLETSGDDRAKSMMKEEEQYWNPKHAEYSDAPRPGRLSQC